ncbi:alanyl-tRNA editing protein [Alkalihalobacterium alkalinitrilicum]|uniref:alanyl-tRNA editing protein n=1 Tax=Alkalihalobacterium alkalinitrilicum TaxID=427920 RepID=UPI000994EA4B|nr:DHHA1 domain-containing protein [Alkalihalobacterium alkalinitrilicum]
MEERLYYENAYKQSFSAQVLKQTKDEAGNWYVVLEQTAFYPTGGGQPHDIGTINETNVTNVEEIDGEIRHFIETPLDDEQHQVVGAIDWQRRFDHMQQHLGQHILSACFEELFNMATVSFHLGTENITIDLEADQLTIDQVEQVERLANQVILENRPVETIWVKEAQLSQYPLRKTPTVSDDIRLVIIPELDYNGCGGTHPNTTAQVRAIQILNWERQNKKIRVHFVCGERVLTQFQSKHRTLSELTQLLSTPEQEMVVAVQRLLNHEKLTQKSLEEAHEQLIQYEVNELLSESKMVNGETVLTHVFQNRTIKDLQKLVRLLTNGLCEINVFLVAENDDKLQVVFGRGEGSEINMKTTVGQILPLINGKGGGNEAIAQGGGEAILTGEQLIVETMKLLQLNGENEQIR